MNNNDIFNTGTQIMFHELDEQKKEQYKMTWINLSEETRNRYIKELDEAVRFARKTLSPEWLENIRKTIEAIKR